MTDALATEVLENVKRRMQGMWARVYKVRAWVNPTDANKDHPYSYEDVFLTESAAQRQYKIQVNELGTWKSMSNICSGKAMLFIPHVFDDGSLAYWPDNDKYIELYEWGM